MAGAWGAQNIETYHVDVSSTMNLVKQNALSSAS